MEKDLEFLRWILSKNNENNIFDRIHYDLYDAHIKVAENSFDVISYTKNIKDSIVSHIGNIRFIELFNQYNYEITKKEKFTFHDLVIEGL